MNIRSFAAVAVMAAFTAMVGTVSPAVSGEPPGYTVPSAEKVLFLEPSTVYPVFAGIVRTDEPPIKRRASTVVAFMIDADQDARSGADLQRHCGGARLGRLTA